MKDLNLCVVKDSFFLKVISSKNDLVKDDSVDGYFIKSSESEARRIIESLKGSGKIIAFVGGDNALNRRAIETLKIDYLVSSEGGNKNDSLKQRDSGFNHVLAKEAAKRGISLVIDFSSLSLLSPKLLSDRISRIMQNIVVCRKVNCGVKIASLSTNKSSVMSAVGRKSFGVSLGMSSDQSSKSVVF